MFSQHQFDFLPGRSTLQQLLIFINKLLETKSNKVIADVIYLDFHKAFDSVPHAKIIIKIKVLWYHRETLGVLFK